MNANLHQKTAAAARWCCRLPFLQPIADLFRLRNKRRRRDDNAAICLWGFDQHGNLTHVRVHRDIEAPHRKNVDIPAFLRNRDSRNNP